MKNLTEHAAQLAIEQADGNLTLAAASLGMMRCELWQCVTRWPAVLDFLTDQRETMVDTAEMILRGAVDEKKPWAVCFAMKTQGKDRGFGKPAPKKRERKKTKADKAGAGQMNTEDLTKFQRLQTIASSTGDGTPEPEFVSRLDQVGAGVALAGCAGNLRYAAEKLGVTREQLIEYLTRRPLLLDAVGDARKEVVDHAESALRAALADKKPWAVRFTLKTLGAPRGYTEGAAAPVPATPELVTPATPEPVAPSMQIGELDLSRLNDEQLAEWERLMELSSDAEKARVFGRPIVVPAVAVPATPATTSAAGSKRDVPVVQASLPVLAASCASEDACITVDATAEPVRKLPDFSSLPTEVSARMPLEQVEPPKVGRIANPSYDR